MAFACDTRFLNHGLLKTSPTGGGAAAAGAIAGAGVADNNVN